MGRQRRSSRGRVWLEVTPGTGAGEGSDAGGHVSRATIWRAGPPGPIGELRWRIGWPGEGLAAVEALELAADEQGWGYGPEAVLRLEDRLKENGVKGVAVGVDREDGLALFFWLRLGYRSMPAGESPADGRFWMVRMLGGAGF